MIILSLKRSPGFARDATDDNPFFKDKCWLDMRITACFSSLPFMCQRSGYAIAMRIVRV